MNPFTVVGYYDDNGQTVSWHVHANSPEDAAIKAVHLMLVANEWEDEEADNIVICEVFEGHLNGCFGNDQTVYGSDVLALEKGGE
jgi:hypothetical protein